MIRKSTIKRMLELLNTVQEGVDYIGETQNEAVFQVIDICQWAINEVSAIIQEEAVGSSNICLKNLKATSENITPGLTSAQRQSAVQQLAAVREALLEEPARLEVAFFPYKQSMWDCMESVWRAADADPMCDCYVVPIPYYDRNPDNSLGTFHYEGVQFPQDIPVVDYMSYDVTIRKPDIIYIHNPYDKYNWVTSVDPHYYSHELKKYTDMLVYIPYYIAGSSKEQGTKTTLTMLSAYYHADRIIAQSEGMTQGLVHLGISEKRILTLGTPKLDYALQHQLEKEDLTDWREKLEGRTVFLVNTSLTDLLGRNRKWLSLMKKLFADIAEHKNCAVIWRPHPLTEATIRSMRPNLLQLYQDMKSELQQLDNFIFDQNSSYLPAFQASHAMISDYSSLFMMYGVTEKPVLLLTGSKSEKKTVDYLFIDYYDYYFLEDGFEVDAFIDIVKKGKDPGREKRLASFKASLTNADGTAGEKIHRAVVRAAMEQ